MREVVADSSDYLDRAVELTINDAKPVCKVDLGRESPKRTIRIEEVVLSFRVPGQFGFDSLFKFEVESRPSHQYERAIAAAFSQQVPGPLVHLTTGIKVIVLSRFLHRRLP